MLGVEEDIESYIANMHARTDTDTTAALLRKQQQRAVDAAARQVSRFSLLFSLPFFSISLSLTHTLSPFSYSLSYSLSLSLSLSGRSARQDAPAPRLGPGQRHLHWSDEW
jgi:hypothetical protein